MKLVLILLSALSASALAQNTNCSITSARTNWENGTTPVRYFRAECANGAAGFINRIVPQRVTYIVTSPQGVVSEREYTPTTSDSLEHLANPMSYNSWRYNTFGAQGGHTFVLKADSVVLPLSTPMREQVSTSGVSAPGTIASFAQESAPGPAISSCRFNDSPKLLGVSGCSRICTAELTCVIGAVSRSGPGACKSLPNGSCPTALDCALDDQVQIRDPVSISSSNNPASEAIQQ